MALKINKYTKSVPSIWKDYVLPRISGRLTVIYAQKEYKVVGYHDFRDKLILRDPKQPDDELIVEINKVKPLLRKMNSMTIREKERYQELLDGVANQTTGVWEVTEWLNNKLFDYKNLIGQRLAEEM